MFLCQAWSCTGNYCCELFAASQYLIDLADQISCTTQIWVISQQRRVAYDLWLEPLFALLWCMLFVCLLCSLWKPELHWNLSFAVSCLLSLICQWCSIPQDLHAPQKGMHSFILYEVLHCKLEYFSLACSDDLIRMGGATKVCLFYLHLVTWMLELVFYTSNACTCMRCFARLSSFATTQSVCIHNVDLVC